jgi:hypothetical protein
MHKVKFQVDTYLNWLLASIKDFNELIFMCLDSI